MNKNVKSIKASENYVKYSYDVKLSFMLDLCINIVVLFPFSGTGMFNIDLLL